MLKKVLMALSVAGVVLCGSFPASLAWARTADAILVDTFFKAVVSDDPEQLLALCDPRLRKEIDAPVLGAWMNEVQAKLGEYRGLDDSKLDTRVESTSQGEIVEIKGTVQFEHGDATADLTFCDDRLIAFSVKAAKIEGPWFKGPTETDLYQERGEEFIRKFLAQDLAGAAMMMAKELRKVVPDDKLAEFMKILVDKSGALKSVEYRDDKFTTENGGTLKVYYDLECEKWQYSAEIKYQFNGLKGYLEGFDIKRQEE